MNAFDSSILSCINRFVGQHPAFDKVVVYLGTNCFLRGGIIAALCWWAWFMHGEDRDKSKAARETIISAMLAAFVSILFVRLLDLALPFRTRPVCDPANGWHFPSGATDWQNWSSFPSDHAIMFFALTTCLFFISRALGWIALLETVFLICLPRIYLGIHYPTDILAGAVIGLGIGFLANQKPLKKFAAQGAFRWMEKSPGSFYAAFFLFMYQITVLFWDVRNLAGAALRALLKY